MKTLMCLLLALIMFGCTVVKAGTKIDKKFDRTAQKIEITVYVYKNKQEVTKALKEHMKVRQTRKSLMKIWGIHWAIGWATWSNPSKKGTPTCEIHVIDPKKTQDHEVMETWGHELVHCTYGEYHKAGER